MGLTRSAPTLGIPPVSAAIVGGLPQAPPGYRGHSHFWRRALSRRAMVQAAGASALATLGSRPAHPHRAYAAQTDDVMPRPIPGGIDLGDGNVLHVFFPEPGQEPSTIGDFRGFVGVSHARGEGTVTRGGGAGGLSTPTATGDRLVYDADMRFMQGRYVGEDGREHDGTFAFV